MCSVDFMVTDPFDFSTVFLVYKGTFSPAGATRGKVTGSLKTWTWFVLCVQRISTANLMEFVGQTYSMDGLSVLLCYNEQICKCRALIKIMGTHIAHICAICASYSHETPHKLKQKCVLYSLLKWCFWACSVFRLEARSVPTVYLVYWNHLLELQCFSLWMGDTEDRAQGLQ